MKYTIRSDDPIPLTLLETNKPMAILRNIALILSTRYGTCPMAREYGLRMSWVHRPLLAAEALVRAELSEALERLEPRAELEDVKMDFDPDGKYILTVEVDIT